jgi:hypothetical protein
MTRKKVWVDGVDGPIECICCDHEGRRVVFGHGNKVSMAHQTTICGYFSSLSASPDLTLIITNASLVEGATKST